MFEMLERLSDPELEGENLQKEIARGKVSASIGKVMVDNASLMLEAEKFKDDRINAKINLPTVFESKETHKAIEVSNE